MMLAYSENVQAYLIRQFNLDKYTLHAIDG